MELFLGITVKRVTTCRCLDGHVKIKTLREFYVVGSPTVDPNFFFSPPAHLCAVTYITEISLHVMYFFSLGITDGFSTQNT